MTLIITIIIVIMIITTTTIKSLQTIIPIALANNGLTKLD
jgi:hypothetical protein